MENKVIQINCMGNIEEIILSLKEVIRKLEDDFKEDPYSRLETGKQIESYDHSVLLIIKE